MEPTRLFDLPEYQLSHYPKPDMMAAKENGEWKSYPTEWFVKTALQLAGGFNKAGIGYSSWDAEGRDKVAVLSENRPEWLLIDQACQQCGAVLTPIYPTIHPAELLHILKEAAIKWVFVSDKALYEKVEALQDKFPDLKAIFSFEKIEGVRHWQELLEGVGEKQLKEIETIKAHIKPEDMATIIYTSGTSGRPKGVMLSHQNILSNVLAGYKCLPVNNDGRALSFLPLNHVYERMISYLYIYAGIPIYYAESMDTIAENLKEVKPYIFTTVPRLLEKVYERIMEKGHQLRGLQKKIFFWSLSVGSRYELNTTKSLGYRLQLALARKLVFSKWREALGGQVEAIITGSAACQVRLLKLFTAAEVAILEGYGLTETSPVISVNRMEKKDRKFGTVGPVIDKVEVKIASDGVILCKGPNIMIGYYKQPELTKEALQDGWFYTGDIGEIVEGRFLKITDRKKELFKTSGGKYVAPLPIETKMVESPFIKQIMLVGDNLKFTSALIVPDFERVQHYLYPGKATPTDPEKLIQLPDVTRLIMKEVEKYNKDFNHVEQVKKIKLLSHEWTIDAGELTPTLKLKRKVIVEKYKGLISEIYH